jgi:flagellar biosynthesis anti-sigma factor FlgM
MSIMTPISFRPIGRVFDTKTNATTKNKLSTLSGSIDEKSLTLLAQNLVRSGPPFDSSRVADIKTQISSGSYTINSGMIADAMIAFYTGAGK